MATKAEEYNKRLGLTPAPAAPVAPAATQPAAPALDPTTTANPTPTIAAQPPGRTLFQAEQGSGQSAINITPGNIQQGLTNQAQQGVLANGAKVGGLPNNAGDIATGINAIAATSSGLDISQETGKSPLVIAHGPISQQAMQGISDRVDWSPGSANVLKVASDAQYKDEVDQATKINAINGLAPTNSQIKTLGLTTDQQMNLLMNNNQGGRFDKQIAALTTQAANEKSLAVEGQKAQAAIMGHQIAAQGNIAAANARALGMIGAAELKAKSDNKLNTKDPAQIAAYKGWLEILKGQGMNDQDAHDHAIKYTTESKTNPNHDIANTAAAIFKAGGADTFDTAMEMARKAYEPKKGGKGSMEGDASKHMPLKPKGQAAKAPTKGIESFFN